MKITNAVIFVSKGNPIVLEEGDTIENNYIYGPTDLLFKLVHFDIKLREFIRKLKSRINDYYWQRS